jgi:alkylation response protein AidB-like acyl-CoA dehydrogenase
MASAVPVALAGDVDDDPDFRERVRTWLAEHVPREKRPIPPTEARSYDLAWQRTMFDGGWAGISWPSEFGGLGLPLLHQMVWHEEYAKARAPYVGVCFVGLNHGGPTLIARGTDEQKATNLPPILRGDVVWCQGFSEPGAGSDLASLSTRGEIDGDEIVVNGQKIWTSYGDVADLQELLVRTDRSGSKHQGITWVVCDMRSPGIEVRPMTTMAGTKDFCEVFYTDVRIPLRNVVGEVDKGWSVALSTLAFERGTAFVSQQIDLARTVEELIDYARTTTGLRRRPLIEDEQTAQTLARLRAEVTAMRALSHLMISRAESGEPDARGSIVRLFFTQLQQRVWRAAFDLLGPRGLSATEYGGWTYYYLHSFSRTIAGGTKDIQRNIIGERVLGLPRN